MLVVTSLENFGWMLKFGNFVFISCVVLPHYRLFYYVYLIVSPRV